MDMIVQGIPAADKGQSDPARGRYQVGDAVTRNSIVGAFVALTGAAVTAQKKTLAAGAFFLDLDESNNCDLIAAATGYLDTSAASGARVAGNIIRMADNNMQPDKAAGPSIK